MIHVTCRLTAKNRDQLRNPTLSNRVWATFLSVVWCDGCGIGFDQQSTGRQFEFRRLRFQLTTLGKLFAHTWLCHRAVYILIPVKQPWFPAAGKVTAGLASHWPCVTEFEQWFIDVHATSRPIRKKDEHPAYSPRGYSKVYFTPVLPLLQRWPRGQRHTIGIGGYDMQFISSSTVSK